MNHGARMGTVVAMAIAALAGCATSGDPATVAERQCGYFANVEGARLVDVKAVEPVAQGDADFKVTMRVEDGLTRRMTAECLYSSSTNKARWATPLPPEFKRV
jgi:hypothetical protein